MKKFIVIAGNIGVGKSTLVNLLSETLGWEPFYEPEADNPYLPDFYRDMTTWAFHSQIFFLTRRLQAHRQITLRAGYVVQDRSVYEDAEIFAYNLYAQGVMSARDYGAYHALYEALCEFLPPPDLIIYLRASVDTLMRRIALRDRAYERTIQPDYLQRLNERYEEWISNFNLCPILTIPADSLDYVAHPGHLALIVRKIQEKLTGKEEVRFAPDEILGSNDG
ncbi:MAG: deoxynucleoside kinase [Anaerolineales bacterium]